MNPILHQLSSEPYLSFLAKLLHGTNVVIVGNILNVHQNINNTDNALKSNYLNKSLNGVFGVYDDYYSYSDVNKLSLSFVFL